MLAMGGMFVLLAVLGATQNYLAFKPPTHSYGAMTVHWPWWRTFVMALKTWACLAPMLWVAARLVHQFPADRENWIKAVLVHFAAALCLPVPIYLLNEAGFLLVNSLLDSWQNSLEILVQFTLRDHLAQLLRYPLVYGAFVAVAFAWNTRRRIFERERGAINLERQLAQAQLQMLRMQLNPHFLFNTLNGITALMRRDPDTAEAMMLALTDFLRATLNGDSTLETSLDRELALVESYLGIERQRFPGRTELVLNVAPECRKMAVPSLILQPLVENAIRHGLAPRGGGGTLTISAWAEGENLHLRVEDDGVGPQSGAAISGLGLKNTRERILQRYGQSGRFSSGLKPEGGYFAEVVLPAERT